MNIDQFNNRDEDKSQSTIVRRTNCYDCGKEMLQNKAKSLILKNGSNTGSTRLILCTEHYNMRVKVGNTNSRT